MSYNFKPQLKTVGPKYGKQLGKIARRWRTWTAVLPRRFWTAKAS